MYNHRDTNRLEGYSDAVLAFAATLLVTGLPSPEVKTGLLQAIAKDWPSYAAFVATFIFIGVAWSNHHDMFRYIRKTDQYLLIINLLFLLFVTLQSFSTGLLAKNVGKPEERTAAFIYHGMLVLMTLLYNCIWWYAIKSKGLLEDGTDPYLIRMLTWEYAAVPISHFAALIICIWSVPFSIVPLILLYTYFAFPRLSEKKISEKRQQDT